MAASVPRNFPGRESAAPSLGGLRRFYFCLKRDEERVPPPQSTFLFCPTRFPEERPCWSSGSLCRCTREPSRRCRARLVPARGGGQAESKHPAGPLCLGLTPHPRPCSPVPQEGPGPGGHPRSVNGRVSAASLSHGPFKTRRRTTEQRQSASSSVTHPQCDSAPTP